MRKLIGQCKFREWDCDVVLEHYYSGGKAISLYDTTTEELIARATVNLPEFNKNVGKVWDNSFVCIKNWSENEGIFEALIKAGIIEDTGFRLSVGPYGATAYLAALKDPDERIDEIRPA